ncbi:hypothetical protein B0H15DRAFT_804770 [Mycena belliarum]|uniref:Origin recognition complex subunit 6 n=1 Tax=Mycena belliarum TaxID=1033014 RepID=A0AAD6TV62_9AGAR|nr:hypothetical protein B0H15DRAFT_804770 [Mycena belliae]
MAPRMQTLEKLCHDSQTLAEAKKLLVTARLNTAAGSGFDLREQRTGLDAACAYIASQNLNNTHVTIQAAQVASCQSMPKFRKLLLVVEKAIAGRKPARRAPLKFGALISAHCSRIPLSAVPLMDGVDVKVVKVLESIDDGEISDDEITCAVFAWFCNLVEGIPADSLEDTYDLSSANMRQLSKILKKICGRAFEAKIREEYKQLRASPAKSASTSPRKSPTKPLRELPTRDSPQKRKVTFPDADDDLPMPDSPTKRPKLAQPTASSSLITLESIREREMRTTRSMSGSPTKPGPAPSTPRRALRTYSRSPSKSQAAATPTRPVKLLRQVDMELDTPAEPPSSDASSDEDTTPPPRRRFRPIFRDQQQWAMRDPRLAKLARAAAEHHTRMVSLYGAPFLDYRRDDSAMTSD